MTYSAYPTITRLETVLPRLEGYEEFKVHRGPELTWIDYVFVTPDSFTDPVRRECRGIKFYPDGAIAARPLHKFFNVGERPGSMPDEIDWARPHHLIDKLDGSMVHPVVIGDTMRLATRKGLTDVAAAAEKYLTPAHWGMFNALDAAGKTATLEFIGPTNRIVIRYPEHRVVLLAVRDTITGEYDDQRSVEVLATQYGVPLAMHSGLMGNSIATLRAHEQTDVEGWVILFDGGERYKVKTDRYVRIHRALDAASREKDVLAVVLRNDQADLRLALGDDHVAQLDAYVTKVEETIDLWADEIVRRVGAHRTSGEERRRFAEEVIGSLPPLIRPAAFALLDDRDTAGSLVRQALLRCTRSQPLVEAARNDALRGLRWEPPSWEGDLP